MSALKPTRVWVPLPDLPPIEVVDLVPKEKSVQNIVHISEDKLQSVTAHIWKDVKCPYRKPKVVGKDAW